LRPDRHRIVVAGMVAGVPGQGGAAWAVLQWVLGFRALGHDVLLVEQVEELTAERVRGFDAVLDRFELRGSAAMVDRQGRTAGLPWRAVQQFSRDADMLWNLAGTLRDPALLSAIDARVYVDLDPAFTQLWQVADGIDMGFDAHTDFVTVGLNIGTGACDIPDCDRVWLRTLPPVHLARWPVAGAPHATVWTTVANWRGYGSPWYRDIRYGQKAHAWRTLADIPQLTSQRLRPALAIHPDEQADLASLRAHGWQWVEPGQVAGSPEAYQRFIAESAGELCIAKEGYVVSNSGWFSDRSACYLASGRPVVAQRTGWEAHLPTGEGLQAFSSAEEAAAAIDRTARGPQRHREVARAIAEEHFDSNRVLLRMLEHVTGRGDAPVRATPCEQEAFSNAR
jgi:hypothetical protein